MAVDRSKYRSSDDRTDRNWPEKDTELGVGDSIEGVYISKKENVGVNNSNVYVLRTEEGELVGVWGSTVLDAKFEKIALDTQVAIEFIGSKMNKSGKGKPYKDFFVGVGDAVAAGDGDDNDVPF
jgi:hypothetical protein